MQRCYDADWERKPFTVCGITLAPLTLGHARVLYLGRSPFFDPGKNEHDLGDLFVAACVCAKPSAPERSELEDVSKSAAALKIERDISEEFKTFAAYLNYYMDSPIRFTPDSAVARMPWPWALYAMLRRHYGYGDKEAWNEVCVRALWMSAAVMIQDGDTTYPALAEAELAATLETS